MQTCTSSVKTPVNIQELLKICENVCVQVDALRGGVEVVVGTPGRLEDLMNDGICVLKVGS